MDSKNIGRLMIPKYGISDSRFLEHKDDFTMPVGEIELFPFEDSDAFNALEFSDTVLNSITRVVVNFEFEECDPESLKKLEKLKEFKNCDEIYYKDLQSATIKKFIAFVIESKQLCSAFSFSGGNVTSFYYTGVVEDAVIYFKHEGECMKLRGKKFEFKSSDTEHAIEFCSDAIKIGEKVSFHVIYGYNVGKIENSNELKFGMDGKIGVRTNDFGHIKIKNNWYLLNQIKSLPSFLKVSIEISLKGSIYKEDEKLFELEDAIVKREKLFKNGVEIHLYINYDYFKRTPDREKNVMRILNLPFCKLVYFQHAGEEIDVEETTKEKICDLILENKCLKQLTFIEKDAKSENKVTLNFLNMKNANIEDQKRLKECVHNAVGRNIYSKKMMKAQDYIKLVE